MLLVVLDLLTALLAKLANIGLLVYHVIKSWRQDLPRRLLGISVAATALTLLGRRRQIPSIRVKSTGGRYLGLLLRLLLYRLRRVFIRGRT